MLHWTDSRGQPWTLEPTYETLTLTGPDDHTTLSNEEWDSKIAYNEAGGRIAFRFDVGNTQVGFMVGREEAAALLELLGWTNERAQESAQRLREPTRRSHTWSTVTAWSIWGLFAAALACVRVRNVLVGRKSRRFLTPIIALPRIARQNVCVRNFVVSCDECE